MEGKKSRGILSTFVMTELKKAYIISNINITHTKLNPVGGAFKSVAFEISDFIFSCAIDKGTKIQHNNVIPLFVENLRP